MKIKSFVKSSWVTFERPSFNSVKPCVVLIHHYYFFTNMYCYRLGFHIINFVAFLPICVVTSQKLAKTLPPGYEEVDGEAVDVTDKVVQMSSESGTLYFEFSNPSGRPIYKRDAYERGWNFIVFDDPYNQDPGGGHFIILQKIAGLSVGSGKILYEAFLLSFEETIAADVEPYDPKEADYYKDEAKEDVKEDFDFLENEAKETGTVADLRRQRRQVTTVNNLKEYAKPYQKFNCELF